MIRIVGDSPYQQYAESATVRINDTQSQFLDYKYLPSIRILI